MPHIPVHPTVQESLCRFGTVQGTLPKYSEWGSYPLYYADNNYDALCPDCANETTSVENNDDETVIDHVDCNWEQTDLYCSNCYQLIESAYAEPEEN